MCGLFFYLYSTDEMSILFSCKKSVITFMKHYWLLTGNSFYIKGALFLHLHKFSDSLFHAAISDTLFWGLFAISRSYFTAISTVSPQHARNSLSARLFTVLKSANYYWLEILFNSWGFCSLSCPSDLIISFI